MMSLRIFLLIFIAFFAGGCSSMFYVPSSHQIPLFREKGESRISGLIYRGGQQSGEQLSGIQLNTAFALAPRGALVAGVMSSTNSATKYLNELHAGYGYFGSQPEGHFVWEFYGIGFYGRSSNFYTDGSVARANYLKEALQANFGYRSKFFDAGISWRFGGLQFVGIHADTPISEAGVLSIRNTSSVWFSEPALMMRLGIEHVKLDGQFGFSSNTASGNYPAGNFQVGIGLTVLLD